MLTNYLLTNDAFHPFPIKFNTSSSQSVSFSTHFVFRLPSSGNGIAFVISHSTDSSEADAGAHAGVFNFSNNGDHANHILAFELDIVHNNHEGIDVNSVISNVSASASIFSEKGSYELLSLSGDPIQVWIDYNGKEKLLNVTLAPIPVQKPNQPLLSTHVDLSQILLDSSNVGFSAATDKSLAKRYIIRWSFSRTGKAQNHLPSPPTFATANSTTPMKSKESSSLIIIVPVIGAVLLVAVGVAVEIVGKKNYEEISEEWEKEYGPQRFSYYDLYHATKGFKDKQLIGKGGFGQVFRGVLPSSNLQIAVKRVSHDSKQRMKEFVAEIASMGRLRHRNLVKLHGHCRRKGELLLVYDYMPKGSLDKILYSNTNPNLTWFQRFRIIRGVASGLFYLHEEWEQVVLHRDIKPANVLLDDDLNGRLRDFGLARLYDRGSSLQTTKLVGTIGYMSPEVMRTGKASTSTDVYAFGVFILEVARGRKPFEHQGLPEPVGLVDWVSDYWKRGTILDAGDPRMEGLYAEEQMELVLKLGLFCSHPNPAARPSMRQVMQYLDGEVVLPVIPPEDIVIGLITATNEAGDGEISSSTWIGSSSAHTRSTIDSILTVGR